MNRISLQALVAALLCFGFLPSTRAREETATAPTPPTPDPRKAIQKISGTRYKLGVIEFDQKSREIAIPCKVNMREGLLEYALVHEAGKTHESLLSTKISPFDLNVVLLLVNYKPSERFFDFSNKELGPEPVKDPKIEPSARCDAWVRWKTEDGKESTARLESWVLNLDEKGPAKDGPFVYTGSMISPEGKFMAQDNGSILALYLDASALINNPRPGNDNDDIWIANKEKVPAPGTEVTLLLRPPATGGAEDKKPEKSGKSSENSSKKSGGARR